jgi:hypothetical protein
MLPKSAVSWSNSSVGVWWVVAEVWLFGEGERQGRDARYVRAKKFA